MPLVRRSLPMVGTCWIKVKSPALGRPFLRWAWLTVPVGLLHDPLKRVRCPHTDVAVPRCLFGPLSWVVVTETGACPTTDACPRRESDGAWVRPSWLWLRASRGVILGREDWRVIEVRGRWAWGDWVVSVATQTVKGSECSA